MSIFRKIVLYPLMLLVVSVAIFHSDSVQGQGDGVQNTPAAATGGSRAGSFVWRQRSYVDWWQASLSQTTQVGTSWTIMDSGDFGNSGEDGYSAKLAVFDADGDGNVDIAVSGWDRNSLYLNNGEGQFTPAEAGDFDDVKWEQGRETLLVFDADGDGDEDILIDKMRLFLNNGAGYFTIADAGDLSHYLQDARSMAALDADGDGDIDVALAPTYGNNVLFVNDGSGKFTQQDAGDFDDEPLNPSTLLAFDVDGDGDADLLGGPGQLYLNDGSGRFIQTDAGELDQVGGIIRIMIAFDMDGDNDLDLVLGKAWHFSDPTLLFFANDGAGKFSKIEPGEPANETNEIRSLAAFDADNDGDMDLAVGPYHIAGSLYLNDGAGDFAKINLCAFGKTSDMADVKALDADGDGVIDMAVSTGNGNFLLRNQLLDDDCIRLAYQGFSRRDQFGKTHYEAYDKAIFDADGDGDMDILLGGKETTLLLNVGHGRYVVGDNGALHHLTASTIVAFDADGDGDMDVATGNTLASSPNTLWINDGHGGFAQRDAGAFDDADEIITTAMTAFDVDGDGDLDLAITARLPTQHEVQGLFLNDGTGVFTLADAGDFNGGDSGHAMAAFDADGDGDLDLALGTDSSNRLYLNDGSGHFTRSDDGDFVRHPNDGYATAMIAFDADGDGDLDLAASYIRSEHLNKNYLYLNDGAGRLMKAEAGNFDDEKVDITYDLAIADVDGDEDLDIVSANGAQDSLDYGRTNSIFLNDGHAQFTQVNSGDFSVNRQRSTQLGAFDADGDGDVDLVTANWPGPSRQYLNDGNGTFISAPAGALNDASDSNTIVALDADEDGDLDLAVGNWGPNEFYLNDGSGAYTPVDAGDFTASDFNTSQLLAVDINRDGHTDLVAGVFAAPNLIYLGDGSGGFTLADAGDFDNASARTYAVAALDVDGDGDLDLAVGNWGEANALYLNDGSGRFHRIDAGAFDDDASQTTTLAALDADGDGDMDLAEGNNDGGYDVTSQEARRNRLFLNDGAGHFTLMDAGDFSALDEWTNMLLAVDIDSDGDMDLAEAAKSSDGIYFNDGSGHFYSPSQSDSLDRFGLTEAIATLDADGDGDMDLIAGNQGIFFNNGGGVLHRMNAGDFSDGWRRTKALVVFDADGDGDADVAEAVWGENAQYLNRGLYETGVVTSPAISPFELCPDCEGAAVWKIVKVTDNIALHTALTYDVLDAATGQPIPGYRGLRPDAAGNIDLSGVDAGRYSAIRLRARFVDLDAGSDNNDQSPRLCAWSVFYDFVDLHESSYLPMMLR